MINIKNNILNNVNDFDNVYIVSDIHGCQDKFHEMLDKIKFNDKRDLLIILGDIIDRGNHGVELLQEIFNMNNTVLLKGNHEDMMIRSLSNDMNWMSTWLKYNKGHTTLDKFLKLDKEIQKDILKRLKELPEYLKIEINGKLYLLVHAGIRILKGYTLDKMIEYSDILWIRYEFLKSKVETDFKVICGHTITDLIPYEIHRTTCFLSDEELDNIIKGSEIFEDNKNKICIDCGIAYGGNLACLELKTMNKYYVK